jgi:hypothetical protein
LNLYGTEIQYSYFSCSSSVLPLHYSNLHVLIRSGGHVREKWWIKLQRTHTFHYWLNNKCWHYMN